MAGSAKVLASQVSPFPGLARQSPRPRVRGGWPGADRAWRGTLSGPRGARDAGQRGTTGTGSRSGGPIPAQQVLGYCRARGGSRGLLPQAGAARLARQPLGKPLTPDGPWRRWLLVQVTDDLSAQVTEGLAVPGPVSVSLITC